MRRRDFIALAGGAAAWPLAAHAESATKPVIGFLRGGSLDDIRHMASAFAQGLKETGYTEGENVVIEYRSANGEYDRLPAMAADLVARRVAVIVAAGGTTAHAAMAATSTIPIVFVSATDPVVMKIVTSLNRPGGNVTGVSLLGVALEAKRLELLHAIVPNASTLAALINPGYPGAKMQVEELQEAAARLGVKLITFGASTAADIDDAFAALARQGAGGLLAAQDPLVLTRRDQVTGLAARYAIPVIFALREIVVEGGLMSYGAVFSNGYYQGGNLCRQNTERRIAGRFAGSAADQVRVRHQSQDRQSTRRCYSRQAARYR